MTFRRAVLYSVIWVVALMAGAWATSPKPPRATSTTGIAVGKHCAQVAVDPLDRMNRQPGLHAEIVAAYCRSGRVVGIALRGADGCEMRWVAAEGATILAERLVRGRCVDDDRAGVRQGRQG